ncbi:MAG: hypothetical protein ACE5JH_05090 [Acidobacteriota bacterium]
MATCSHPVRVRDTRAPELAVHADPGMLWPSNRRRVPVRVRWEVGDLCDPSPRVVLPSAASNEPDDEAGQGDGSTTGDIADAALGLPDEAIPLRAERSGRGTGRVYGLTYAAIDASGNRSSAPVLVRVPHDLGDGSEPLLLGMEHAGSRHGGRVYWSAVERAEGYDLIKGDAGELRMDGPPVSLGAVSVLVRRSPATSDAEDPASAAPPAGGAFYYLLQYRRGGVGAGFGTEGAPCRGSPPRAPRRACRTAPGRRGCTGRAPPWPAPGLRAERPVRRSPLASAEGGERRAPLPRPRLEPG